MFRAGWQLVGLAGFYVVFLRGVLRGVFTWCFYVVFPVLYVVFLRGVSGEVLNFPGEVRTLFR